MCLNIDVDLKNEYQSNIQSKWVFSSFVANSYLIINSNYFFWLNFIIIYINILISTYLFSFVIIMNMNKNICNFLKNINRFKVIIPIYKV